MGHIFYVPFVFVAGVLLHKLSVHFAKKTETYIEQVARTEAAKVVAFMKREEKKL